ncbi:MAG: hypothetical protein H7Y37_06420 [Anaerolineae bacterium]|nr:hypothetical protein [Gloeobacterales cyanobacterium ES-bin-313]
MNAQQPELAGSAPSEYEQSAPGTITKPDLKAKNRATSAAATPSAPSDTAVNGSGKTPQEAKTAVDKTPELNWVAMGVSAGLNTLPSLIFFILLWLKLDKQAENINAKIKNLDNKVSTLQGSQQSKTSSQPSATRLPFDPDLKSKLERLTESIEELKQDIKPQAVTVTTAIDKQVEPDIPIRSDLHPFVQRYNAILSKYEDNAERKSTLEGEYRGQVTLASVSNSEDLDSEVPPELKEASERATFYLVEDETSYLALPIPSMASVGTSYAKAMYNIEGDGLSVASIQKPAQFKQQSNVWRLVSKGKMTVG